MIRISRKKIYRVMADKGLRKNQVSAQAGKSGTWLSVLLRRLGDVGDVEPITARALADGLQCSIEDIEADEPPAGSETEATA